MEIIQRSKGDAIVFIDADHNIHDSAFIQKIATAFQRDPSVGLATCYVRPLQAQTFIESAVNNYHEAREHTLQDYDFRHSIYALHGTYAVSKSFGHSIHFPKNILNEDAYVYLFAKTQHVGFTFVQNTSIYFRSPQNIHDQMIQFQRHMKGGKQLETYFGEKMVHDEFFVLFKAMFKIMIYQFAKNPLKYGTLRTLNFINQFYAKRGSHGYNALWAQIDSSKKLA
jgi:glycosyltransferase involved in cell wall biosynthesis